MAASRGFSGLCQWRFPVSTGVLIYIPQYRYLLNHLRCWCLWRDLNSHILADTSFLVWDVYQFHHKGKFSWWGTRDSNPHAFRQRCLRPPRLPFQQSPICAVFVSWLRKPDQHTHFEGCAPLSAASRKQLAFSAGSLLSYHPCINLAPHPGPFTLSRRMPAG